MAAEYHLEYSILPNWTSVVSLHNTRPDANLTKNISKSDFKCKSISVGLNQREWTLFLGLCGCAD